ncbi:MAG: sigma-70 family RNA polymerase sigma factor [Oscillospiraceae bacterium]|nr:sigma-70 family RNA polymerase sigma factor [Oscillospiraceae bacterium]
MGTDHWKHADPRPRRRRDPDNPYRVFSTGIDTTSPRYYLAFTDGCGARHCLEIDKDLFEAFDQFELEDISQMHRIDRHYEQSEQTEISLYKRAACQLEDVEETVFHQLEAEALYRAIGELPEVQRRRLTLYYFDGLTYEEIAKLEGCSYPAIMKSVSIALREIRKIFPG